MQDFIFFLSRFLYFVICNYLFSLLLRLYKSWYLNHYLSFSFSFIVCFHAKNITTFPISTSIRLMSNDLSSIGNLNSHLIMTKTSEQFEVTGNGLQILATPFLFNIFSPIYILSKIYLVICGISFLMFEVNHLLLIFLHSSNLSTSLALKCISKLFQAVDYLLSFMYVLHLQYYPLRIQLNKNLSI